MGGRLAVGALLACALAATAKAAQEPRQSTNDKAVDGTVMCLSDEELVERLKGVRPNRELRPEARLFEPSKLLLLPHVFQKGASPSGAQDRLAIEVEFNETFFPYQNPPSATDRHFGGWSMKVAVTPMYRVRIWKEESAPVRVPSFMPKGTLQFEHVSKRTLGSQWSDRGHVGVDTWTLVPLGHHSNGQDGCLYAPDSSGVGYPAGSCPVSPDPSRIFINRQNGSFSTNYAELSYYHSWLVFAPQSDDRYDVAPTGYDQRLWTHERRVKHALVVGATYQYNYPFDFTGGALERPVRRIYGMNRFKVTASYEKFWVEKSPRPPRLIPRLRKRFLENAFSVRLWLEASDKSRDAADCQPSGPGGLACAPKVGFGGDLRIGLFSKADGLSLYSRFMRVQDYYNLSFTRRKGNEFQTGLAFSLSRGRGPAFPVLSDEALANEKARKTDSSRYRKAIVKAYKKKDGAASGPRS